MELLVEHLAANLFGILFTCCCQNHSSDLAHSLWPCGNSKSSECEVSFTSLNLGKRVLKCSQKRLLPTVLCHLSAGAAAVLY